MGKLRILRWFGIICFGLVASILHGSEATTDISADGCRLYIAEGSRIRQFDLCRDHELPDFNSSALPDHRGAQQIRVLPDRGLLVANFSVIARFHENGTLAGAYDLPNHDCWSGITLHKDAFSFWAWSSCTSDVVRFDLNDAQPLAVHTTHAISDQSRMFGGGTVYSADGVQVNHGFDLHCSASVQPNYVQVVWNGGNVFFMENMTSVSCTGSPFNTIAGTGTGTINGQPAPVSSGRLWMAAIPAFGETRPASLSANAAGEVVAQASGRIVTGSHTAKE